MKSKLLPYLLFLLILLNGILIFMLVKKPRIADSVNVKNGWERTLGKLFIILCRNRKGVLLTYLVITIITLIGASRIKFDYFLMQDLGEGQPLMKELRYFQKQFGGIRPFELAIIPQNEYLITDFEVMQEVEKLEDFLKHEAPVIVRRTVEDYCARHFGTLAKDILTAELRRLADEKARLLVDG